jgi:hypothetical protein
MILRYFLDQSEKNRSSKNHRGKETGEEQEVVPSDFFTIFIVGGYLMKIGL